MRDIFIIRKTDGLILRRLSCPEEEIAINVHDGEFSIDAIDGDYNHYNDDIGFYKVSEVIPDEIKMLHIRQERDGLLNEADLVYCNAEKWSRMSDIKKQEWIDYKQQLRDFPDNCDINNPIFPARPTGE